MNFAEECARAVMEHLWAELDLTMAFCGQTDIRNVGRHVLLG